jgi:hypothetical protein
MNDNTATLCLRVGLVILLLLCVAFVLSGGLHL